VGISVGSDGSNQIGVAPGAKWIACRNMDSGVGRPSTYIECLNFFLAPTDLNGNNPDVSKRPDIISNSYGCPPTEECSPHSLQAAVEIVRSAGIFMAVSAGNNGSNGCSTVYDPPGLEKAVFSVGAVNSSNTIADFSSRGPVLINGEPVLRKPDIVAPGVSIYSSYRNGNYTWLSGTSMAAPHIAGAVALLWSGLPNLRNNVDLTENALGQSALHLTSTQGCGGDSSSSIPNNVYGYGLVQVKNAYDLLSASPIPTLTALPGLTVIPSVTVSPTITVTPQPASQKGYLPQVSNE
jgi:subtilisin family serine protease